MRSYTKQLQSLITKQYCCIRLIKESIKEFPPLIHLRFIFTDIHIFCFFQFIHCIYNRKKRIIALLL